jgi:hypothetical protein
VSSICERADTAADQYGRARRHELDRRRHAWLRHGDRLFRGDERDRDDHAWALRARRYTNGHSTTHVASLVDHARRRITGKVGRRAVQGSTKGEMTVIVGDRVAVQARRVHTPERMGDG